jgi:hypothetical protein
MFAMGDALVDATDARVASPEQQPALDEKPFDRNQAQPRPPGAAGRVASIAPGRGRADPTHERHRRVKSVAALVASSSHEHALAHRIDREGARLDRAIKGICRGC